MSLDRYFTPWKLSFCPYLMTGYPNKKEYMKAVDILVDAWAKIIETGIAFSDPVADGPLLTHINHQMIDKWMNRDISIQIIQEVKQKYPDTGVCIMTYANLIYRYGFESFYAMMNEYKLDALLLPDIPLEEIQEYRKMKWINNIMLVSNNLDDETIIDIAKNSSWFLYVLSFVGTTWAKENYKESVQKNLKQFVLRLRRLLWDEKKLVVWFGIKNKEDIDFLRTIPVDGFIIWSQIAKELQVWWTQALQTYIDNLWLT